MKNRLLLLLLSVTLLLVVASCDKKETRLEDYWVELATVAKTEASTTIVLDNGTILTPNNASKWDIEDGARVILN